MSSAPRWLEQWRAGTLPAAERKLGKLAVPSGAIVACDPLTSLGHERPYTRTVPPGTYEVSIGLVQGDVAFAVLRLDDAPVATWELARSEGATGERPGFGVDAGTACFVDAQVAAAHRAARDALAAQISAGIVASPEDAGAWHAEYTQAQEAHPDPVRVLIRRIPHVLPLEGGNLIAFVSGAGDGCYPAFWGLTAAGAPAVLIIDFHMFDEDEAEEADEAHPDDASARSRAKELLERWERDELLVLTPRAKRDAFVAALAEDLADLEDDDDVGASLSAWLIDRPEIADVFATDEQLEASLRS